MATTSLANRDRSPGHRAGAGQDGEVVLSLSYREKMIAELERWASELDRTATDLQVLRRQVFDLLMRLKTGGSEK
jgi:hypothetical protein